MLFNSFEFLLFFTVVTATFFVLPQKYRWMLLLIASYFFYMSWQPAYALLIAFTTLVSYYTGLKCDTKDKKRRAIFFNLSLLVSLGVLFFFKYFNFLNEGIRELLKLTNGSAYDFSGLDILLPVGISFYTFQTLSYNIDIYFGVRKPEKHLGIFALYVSFFPQLVAGPIERSTSLLPQFFKPVQFSLDRFHHGLKYIIWGLFKKMVIADRLSIYVNLVYNQTNQYGSAAYLTATILFAFQLYCDFSAYSDIARGTAKVLGYDLMENFNHPFTAKNITEFWRKWHISLSTWLRDYLYTPLVFKYKKHGKLAVAGAIFVTFLLCGLWHGAKVTFIIFGVLQGLALVYELATIELRKKWASTFGSWYNPVSMLLTFGFVLFSFIFFRANTLSDSYQIVSAIFSLNYQWNDFIYFISKEGNVRFVILMILLLTFILFDKKIMDTVKSSKNENQLIEKMIFSILVALTFIFGYFGDVEFIYFQF
jgi:alginate O-acetyltransferase complex protein AlgI